MEKDAYYFPHFCNARHDRKIMRLRKELGVEGYGIFFMLLEVLREQIDFRYPMKDIDLLADEMGCSEQKLKVVICNYQLFQVDPKEQFFSPKLIVYLEPYLNMKEQRRLAGIKSGEKRALISGTPQEVKDDKPQVYIIKCFNDDEEFIKIGSTTNSISRRFSGHLPYKYEVLKQFFTHDVADSIALETEMQDLIKEFKYKPKLSFSGDAECFLIQCIGKIINHNPISNYLGEHSLNKIEHSLNENEQSKVKESKVNKTKAKEIKDIYIKCQHLSLTKIEYDKLVELYGEDMVKTKLEYAENYKGLTKYVSLYKTLNNWLRADRENPIVRPQLQQQYKKPQPGDSSKRQYDVNELEKRLLGR